MEAGPIDAITNDAKYTLSEEKLLKKYSQHSKQGSNEPTFEAKCLVSFVYTLYVYHRYSEQSIGQNITPDIVYSVIFQYLILYLEIPS